MADDQYNYRRTGESVDDWRKRVETAIEVRADLLREVRSAIETLKSEWMNWDSTSAENYHSEVIAAVDKLADKET